MKVSEIRALSRAEIKQKLVDLKQELFNLRFQHGIGQLENTGKIKKTQIDIARAYTVLSEMARNPQGSDN